MKQKVNSLQDIHTLLIPEEGDSEGISTIASHKEHFNLKYNLVSLMMYLVGIEEHRFLAHVPDLSAKFLEFQENQEARNIRNLCVLRTALMQNYSRIVTVFRYEIKNLSSIPELVPSEPVHELEQSNIRIQKTRPDAMDYIISINKEISNRINLVKYLFPDWIKWDYIRPLFLMPNGTKPEGVKAAADFYNSDRNRYPFQCWMNWKVDGQGNIFYADSKFVDILYGSNNDVFENRSLVIDAGEILLGNLHEFLDSHERTLIVVDCENSDPIKLAAALLSLDVAQRKCIHKIMLFDSDYTTAAWETLSSTGITKEFQYEHIVVPRLYEHKSQVDMTLAVATSKEVFLNGVDAVILVSSDSDYWALIQSLPDADFLVMLEKMKSGQTIRDTLEKHGYIYCFIDDFCTADAYAIKTKTIINAIQTRIDERVDFNVNDMLNDVMQSAWLEMTEKEQELFYKLHLKTMRMNLDKDGNVRILLE